MRSDSLMKIAVSIWQSERSNDSPFDSDGFDDPQQRMKSSCGTGTL